MKWVVKLATAGVIGVFLNASASFAAGLTGSSMLGSDSGFSAGFAWGVIDYRLNVYDRDDNGMQAYLRKCLTDGNVDSQVFFAAAQRTIRSRPDLLPMPATMVVLQTLFAICPDGPQR